MASVWLGRFRIAGKNWEGRDWELTEGGIALAREVNELWPDSHPLDGTVAGYGHDQRNPRSDHRPTPYVGPGIVRALDVGENVENDGIIFAEMLRQSRDPRIKYVLHEDRIFSSYRTSSREPWTWQLRTYGHESHVHVSFTELADNDDSAWNLKGDDMPLNQIERAVVDLAFDLTGAVGDRNYWYDKDNDDPELLNLRVAISSGSRALLERITRAEQGGEHTHSATVTLR